MLFPNLTAEYEADSGCYLCTLANSMNITEEILLNLLYDDGNCTIDELYAAFRSFKWNHSLYNGLNNYCIEYLYAPVLARLNPHKPKNRYRLHVLEEILQLALAERNGIVHGLNDKIISKSYLVITRMRNGEWVTYAEFRNSINGLIYAFTTYRYWRKPQRRSEALQVEIA